jgi:hypothetical protein
MTNTIRKAERKRSKLRIGTSGPAGSGKTYSSLLIARGLASSWSKILLIDSENGSGELYSDLGEYNVITLRAPFTPESYIEAIKTGEDAGMEVIIIDSSSHEWDGKGGCLEINERLASAKYKGNTWAAWSETTPRHQKFIEAITTSSSHIITTARAKTDMIQTEDKKIKKVGMKEIQREGFEYELTVNFTIDRDGHLAMASKDRTGLFISRDPFALSIETGQELKKWNESGSVNVAQLKQDVLRHFKRLNIELPPEKHEWAAFIAATLTTLTATEYDEQNLEDIVTKLSGISDAAMAQTLLKPATPVPAAAEPAEDDFPAPDYADEPQNTINPEDIPF